MSTTDDERWTEYARSLELPDAESLRAAATKRMTTPRPERRCSNCEYTARECECVLSDDAARPEWR